MYVPHDVPCTEHDPGQRYGRLWHTVLVSSPNSTILDFRIQHRPSHCSRPVVFSVYFASLAGLAQHSTDASGRETDPFYRPRSRIEKCRSLRPTPSFLSFPTPFCSLSLPLLARILLRPCFSCLPCATVALYSPCLILEHLLSTDYRYSANGLEH